MERLQKILSQAGVTSRRAGERLMLDGRVSVNGTTVRELGTKADPARDDIRVDGRRVKLVEHHRYLLLNKPRGYVSTRSDPQQRPTVIDLLRGVRDYVYPVGRLDFDSEGLLILTNDGELASRLTHPRHGVPRVYEAQVLGVPDVHDLDRLSRGMTIDGRRTGAADVRLIGSSGTGVAGRPSSRRGGPPASASASARLAEARRRGHPQHVDRALDGRLSRAAESTLTVTIREGRNRQIRKMCDAIGHPVTHLTRVAIGPIRDARLKLGQWRELRKDEVDKLRAASTLSAPDLRPDRPRSGHGRGPRESRD